MPPRAVEPQDIASRQHPGDYLSFGRRTRRMQVAERRWLLRRASAMSAETEVKRRADGTILGWLHVSRAARSGRGSPPNDERPARLWSVASPLVVYEPVEVVSAAAVEREP
jgi:hypothetical protein